MRRVVVLIATALTAFAATQAVASGGGPLEWSRIPLGGGARVTSTAIDCTAASLCVVVKGEESGVDQLFVSDAPWSRGSWRAQPVGLGGIDPSEITCRTKSYCVVLGTRGSNGVPEVWIVVDPAARRSSTFRALTPRFKVFTGNWYGQFATDALSCPRVNLCLAVTASGDLVASDAPASPAVSWRRIGMHSRPLRTLACPSECFGFTIRRRAVVSTDPTGGPAAWRVVPGHFRAVAISCPTVSFCAADGSGFIVASGDPRHGGWRKVDSYAGDRQAISCSGAPQCGSIDPNALGPVTCGSASLCLAFTGGYTGLPLISGAPARGSHAWTHSLPAAAIEGSCSSARECIALDLNGDVLVGRRQR